MSLYDPKISCDTEECARETTALHVLAQKNRRFLKKAAPARYLGRLGRVPILPDEDTLELMVRVRACVCIACVRVYLCARACLLRCVRGVRVCACVVVGVFACSVRVCVCVRARACWSDDSRCSSF